MWALCWMVVVVSTSQALHGHALGVLTSRHPFHVRSSPGLHAGLANDANSTSMATRSMAYVGGVDSRLANSSTSSQSLLSSLSSVSHVNVDPPRAAACGMEVHATADSDWSRSCPADCPLYVEHPGSGCTFSCVADTVQACRSVNPRMPVADRSRGLCRACIVRGCAICALDGTDTCLACSSGHLLHNGWCWNKALPLWFIASLTFGFLLCCAIAWIVDLFRRPVTNEEGLERGLAQRSRAKLHKPRSEAEMIFAAMRSQRSMGSTRSYQAEQEGGVTKHLSRAASRTATRRSTRKFKDGRGLWPISTNLTREEVAGPGLILQFSFQACVIFWAVVVLIGFLALAFTVNTEMFKLGTRTAATPWQNCILLLYGRIMSVQFNQPVAGFVLCVYIFSCIASIAYGIKQQRYFQDIDSDNTTHKDFCAKLKNIPELSGSERVEERIKEAVEAALGEQVVGVSVCWSFSHQDAEFIRVLEHDLFEREIEEEEQEHGGTECPNDGDPEAGAATPANQETSADGDEASKRTSIFHRMEQMLLDDNTQGLLEESSENGQAAAKLQLSPLPSARSPPRSPSSPLSSPRDGSKERNRGFFSSLVGTSSSFDVMPSREALVDALKNLNTSGEAFVVFNTELARDMAVSKARELGGIDFRGSKLKAVVAQCEPHSVLWSNYALSRTRWMLVKRMALGVGAIFIALLFWALVFYMPYVLYMTSLNYEYEEPGVLLSMAFSMLVVIGNALMYLVCSEVSDRIGFLRTDDREVCYMVLYTFACLCNVILDLVVTYWQAYTMMAAQRMRTFDGQLLSRVKPFPDAFLTTYVLPREIGSSFFYYALATFPIPAIAEPFVATYLPYQLMVLIVRSHPEVVGERAEAILQSFKMDLSRYADLLLNLMLMSLAFFLPSGFIFELIILLIVSHIAIYCYDHWRVLRSVPSCVFTSIKADKCAQLLLAVPCGILLTCFVWRARCEVFRGRYCDDSTNLVKVCIATFIIHVFVHIAVVLFVIPLCGKQHKASESSYEDCARRLPSSWFSVNPIYCLRSQFLYEHKPPCDYWVPGKEHLLRVNKDMGWYFTDIKVGSERFVETPTDALVHVANRALGRLHRGHTESSMETPSVQDADSPSPLARGQSSPPDMASPTNRPRGLAS